MVVINAEYADKLAVLATIDSPFARSLFNTWLTRPLNANELDQLDRLFSPRVERIEQPVELVEPKPEIIEQPQPEQPRFEQPQPERQRRSFTTKKGMTVETELTDAEALAELRQMTTHVFAGSLIESHGKFGRWTNDQSAWAHKLANENIAKRSPEKQPTDAGNLKAAFDFIERKHGTKLTFSLDGKKVVLAMGRDRQKVWITNGAKGRFALYGMIRRDGTYQALSRHDDKVLEFIKQFAADPAKVAGEYGRTSGKCCFCNTELTDARSLKVGYGPVCAKNHNLPWSN